MIKSWKDLIPGGKQAGNENKHIPDEQLLALLADKGEELRQLLHRQKELQQKLQNLVQGCQEDSTYARRFEIPIMPLSVKRKEEHEHFLNKKRLETSVAALRRQNSHQEKKALQKSQETLLSDKLKQENKEKSKHKFAADKMLEHWLKKRDRLKNKVWEHLNTKRLDKPAALMTKMESALRSFTMLKDKVAEAYKNFSRVESLDEKRISDNAHKTEQGRDDRDKSVKFSKRSEARNALRQPRQKTERDQQKERKAEANVRPMHAPDRAKSKTARKTDVASCKKPAESQPRLAKKDKNLGGNALQQEKHHKKGKTEKTDSEDKFTKAKVELKKMKSESQAVLKDTVRQDSPSLKKENEASKFLRPLQRMKDPSLGLRAHKEKVKEEFKKAMQKAKQLNMLKEKRKEEERWELRRDLLKKKRQEVG